MAPLSSYRVVSWDPGSEQIGDLLSSEYHHPHGNITCMSSLSGRGWKAVGPGLGLCRKGMDDLLPFFRFCGPAPPLRHPSLAAGAGAPASGRRQGFPGRQKFHGTPERKGKKKSGQRGPKQCRGETDLGVTLVKRAYGAGPRVGERKKKRRKRTERKSVGPRAPLWRTVNVMQQAVYHVR